MECLSTAAIEKQRRMTNAIALHPKPLTLNPYEITVECSQATGPSMAFMSQSPREKLFFVRALKGASRREDVVLQVLSLGFRV